MDEATVKGIFREKLNSVFTPALLDDPDIVSITPLIGYRMFLGKCDKQEAITILNQAINDEGIVNTIVTYFCEFAESAKKKAQEEKEKQKEKQREKQKQKERVEAERKQKEKEAAKKPIKAPFNPKAKPPNKQQTGQVQSLANTIQIPDPVKRIKPNPQSLEQGQPQPQQQPTGPSLATQLLNEGKVKCKYFPFCKNQPCQYFHPTQKCPYFPRCKFSQTCMYVHQPCKFAQNCTRANCFYSHPFKKKSDPMIEFMKMAMGQMKVPNKRPIRKRKTTEDAIGAEKGGAGGEKPAEKQKVQKQEEQK